MKRIARYLTVVASGLSAVVVALAPAGGQERKAVDGLIVNFGVVPASVALSATGHSDAHPLHPPSGSQHLLVTLDDAASGKRIGDAAVAVEVVDPRGYVEKKPLLHTQAGGFADYSELFVFGESGKYSVRVIIKLQPAAKPIETRFTVNHLI